MVISSSAGLMLVKSGGISVAGGLSYSESSGDGRPFQFVATGGLPATAQTIATTAGNNTTRQDRTRHKIGAGGFTTMQVAWGNWYYTQGNSITDLPAVTDFQASMLMNGVLKRLTFSGSNSTTMTAGQQSLLCDAVTPEDFSTTAVGAASMNFYIVARRTVAAGSVHADNSNVGTLTQPAGEPANSIRAIFTDDSNNQVMTGVALNNTGAFFTGGPLPPLAFIGKTASPSISLLATGDSLVWGTNDIGTGGFGDGSNSGGWVARACFNTSTPYVNLARFGSQANSYIDANLTKVKWLYQYATHVINNYGTNDMAVSAISAATVLGYLQTRVWGNFSAYQNVKRIEQIPILPRTTSSDSFKTAANQTPVTGFESGGTRRDALNALIAGNVGSNGLSAVLDMNTSVLEDQTALGKWVSDGVTNNLSTGDGIHRSTVTTLDSASVLEARIATWTPY